MLFKSNRIDEGREYDELFYRYQREGAVSSAHYMLPKVNTELQPGSILDVGCGAGARLSVHGELVMQNVVCSDGNYVDRSVLLFNQSHFYRNDSANFNLGRTFDLGQCLESSARKTRPDTRPI